MFVSKGIIADFILFVAVAVATNLVTYTNVGYFILYYEICHLALGT